MSLFGVNMPLLYGEGRGSFQRLQEEILGTDEDHSLFVWVPRHPPPNNTSLGQPSGCGLFADSPADFNSFAVDTVQINNNNQNPLVCSREILHKVCSLLFPPPVNYMPPQMTSQGLWITLHLAEHPFERYLACLTIFEPSINGFALLCVALQSQSFLRNDAYHRDISSGLTGIPRHMANMFQYTSIYIAPTPLPLEPERQLSRRHRSGFWQGLALLSMTLDAGLQQDVHYIPSPLISVQDVIDTHQSKLDSRRTPTHTDSEYLWSNRRLEALPDITAQLSKSDISQFTQSSSSMHYFLHTTERTDVPGLRLTSLSSLLLLLYIKVWPRLCCKITVGKPKDIESENSVMMNKLRGPTGSTDGDTLILDQSTSELCEEASTQEVHITARVRRIATFCGDISLTRFVISLRRDLVNRTTTPRSIHENRRKLAFEKL